MPHSPPEKTSKHFPRIHVFGGSDFFTKEKKLTLWKEAFAAKHGAFGIASYDVDLFKNKEQDLLNELHHRFLSRNLFQRFQLTIIRGCLQNPPTAISSFLIEHLPSLAEDHYIVFFDHDVDGKTPLFKTILTLTKKGVASVERFEPPERVMLGAWARSFLKEKNARIHPDALSRFLSFVAPGEGAAMAKEPLSLLLLANELEKLIAASESADISLECVERTTSRDPFSHVFTLSDALLSKNRGVSLQCLSALLSVPHAQEKSAALSLLSFLTSQYFSFLSFLSLIEQRVPLAEVAKKLGWSEKRAWVVGKKLAESRKEDMAEMYRDCLHTDSAIKTTPQNQKTLLGLFIWKHTKKSTAKMPARR